MVGFTFWCLGHIHLRFVLLALKTDTDTDCVVLRYIPNMELRKRGSEESELGPTRFFFGKQLNRIVSIT